MRNQKHHCAKLTSSPLVGAFVVIIALALQPAENMAQASEVDDEQPLQRSTPVRARDYVDDYAELNALREGVMSLPSGVQYEVLQDGKGKQPGTRDTVLVHYRAMLANGVEFDNTYEQGKPASLNLGEYLVPGLKEALLLMKEGDEWRVTIPAKMGYSGGRLLRKRDLIYEISLISVTKATDSQAPKTSK